MIADDETALLGAILDGYRDLPALARVLSGTDFYRPVHEQIWNACLAVHADGHQPDPNLVRSRLDGARIDPAYLLELLGAPGVVGANAPHYAEAVREASVKRQIADAARSLTQLADNPEVPSTEALSQCRNTLDQLDRNRPTGRVGMWEAFESVMHVIDNGQDPALPTPWPDLNDKLGGGLFGGQMITIGARPGAGKSLMLENLATEAARRHGVHVLFASLEMSHRDLTQRTVAWSAKVDLTKIRTGRNLSEQDLDSLARCQRTVTDTPVVIDDGGYQTMDDIRAAAWDVRQAARRDGSDLGLVVIDYLQLVEVPASLKRHSRQVQVGEISRKVKRLAKELDIPVAVGAQINRAAATRGGDGEPTMSDLREAGDIEQDSDVIILLHEETVDDGDRQMKTGDLRVIIPKQRQGPTGVLTLQKRGHYARLTSIANHYQGAAA